MRTFSILHQPTFDLTNFRTDEMTSCHSPKSGVKFERKETMDSIEILKKKKSFPPKRVVAEEGEQEEQEQEEVASSGSSDKKS